MPDIYELAATFRAQLLRRERGAATALLRAYATAYRSIRLELDGLLQGIQTARDAGETVNDAWLFRAGRLDSLLTQVDAEIRRAAEIAGERIIGEQSYVVDAALRQSLELVRAAIPAETSLIFHTLPRSSVESLVGFLSDGTPLEALLKELSPSAVEGVRNALINGVVSGKGTREIARGVRDALGGNLDRALTISRTEVMRAYREATRLNYAANRDVLSGWMWYSALDSRTCVICYAMHGTIHDFNETLNDHPRGRCVALPIPKPLRELGIDAPDNERQVEPGVEVFSRLSTERQRAILGPGAYEAYSGGKLSLTELVGERTDARYGRVRYRKPLRELVSN